MNSIKFDKLQSVDRELNRLSEMVVDTRMVAGDELCAFASVAYKMAKISASLGTPGTQSIVDDLRLVVGMDVCILAIEK